MPWYYVVNDGEAPSSSSQIVEQIEVTKEVVLPGVSELNYEAINKEQGHQTQISPNNHSKKGKWICYYLLNFLCITPVD